MESPRKHELPPVLAKVLTGILDADVDDLDHLTLICQDQNQPLAAQFKAEFAQAIRAGMLTPDTYLRYTGADFDTQEELDQWLRHVWSRCFPNDPYPGDEGRS